MTSQRYQHKVAARRPWGAFVLRHLLGVTLVVYCLFFWQSLRGLPPIAANYPRIVIGVLVVLVLIGVLIDLIAVIKRRELPAARKQDDADLEASGTVHPAGQLRGFLDRWRKPIAVTALVALYLRGITVFGFWISTVAFLAAGLLVLGIRRPLTLIGTVSGVSICAYLLLDMALGLHLPAGDLIGG